MISFNLRCRSSCLAISDTAVGGVRLVVPIRFSDLEDFPPNLFNSQCYLPFVHGFQNRDRFRCTMSLAAISYFYSVCRTG